MRSRGSDNRIAQETNTSLAEFIRGERCVMPVWMEILINVIGYAGFVAVATYHRPSSEKLPDR